MCNHTCCLAHSNVPVNVSLFQLLAVELLNVLHRLLLTRDPPAVQLQVTAVVQETVRAALEHLQQTRSHKGQERTCSSLSASLQIDETKNVWGTGLLTD